MIHTLKPRQYDIASKIIIFSKISFDFQGEFCYFVEFKCITCNFKRINNPNFCPPQI